MALQKSGQAVSNTLKKLRDTHVHTAYGFGILNHCLAVATRAWQVPAGHFQPSAIAAWKATPTKHRHTDPKKAPVGAVHFWVRHDGTGYGHIATQSDVIGYVWTTDSPIINEVGLQALPFFSSPSGWNMKYLGWSDWLEGYALPVKVLPYKKPGK